MTPRDHGTDGFFVAVMQRSKLIGRGAPLTVSATRSEKNWGVSGLSLEIDRGVAEMTRVF